MPSRQRDSRPARPLACRFWLAIPWGPGVAPGKQRRRGALDGEAASVTRDASLASAVNDPEKSRIFGNVDNKIGTDSPEWRLDWCVLWTNSKRRISYDKNDFASLRHFCHPPMQLAGATPDPKGGFPPKTHAEEHAREATRPRCALVAGGDPGPLGETGSQPVCVGRAERADRLPRPLLVAGVGGSEGEGGRPPGRCPVRTKKGPILGAPPYFCPPSPSRR